MSLYNVCHVLIICCQTNFPMGTNKVVLYCIVLYCVVLYCISSIGLQQNQHLTPSYYYCYYYYYYHYYNY